MKRGLVAVGLAALLLLTGCSAPAQENVSVDSDTSAATVPEDSAAPLVAETPSEAPTAASPEGAFLAQVRDVLPDDTTIPNASDEQLLTAGDQACDQMAAGTDFSAVAVIEGEQANGLGIHEDSALIAATARKTLCP